MVKFDIKDPFSRLLIVFLLWLAWSLLSGGLFEIYLSNQGISQKDIFFTNIAWFIAPLFLLPFIRKFSVRNSILVGITIAFIATLTFMLSPASYSGYLYRFIIGFTIFFFWVPFNTAYYEFRKDNHAQMGAIYYSMSPILTLFLPLFSGYVATTFGFTTLFITSIITLALAFYAAYSLLEDRPYKFDLRSSLRSISGLRSLLFFEGFSASMIVGTTLSILLLDYASTPLAFGVFMSLATVFSVAASMITAKLSDQSRQRRRYLLPVIIGFALSVIAAAMTKDILVFFIAMGMVNFFSRIFFPLPLALAVDNSKSIADSMVAREFMLNLGRIAGVLAGIAILFFSDIRGVLLFEGLALILYIPIFENRKHKLERQ